MSDIHGTAYVSASGDDSTQATVNPVFKTMTKTVSVNPDKIVVLDGDYPATDPMVMNGIPIEIRDGNITTGEGPAAAFPYAYELLSQLVSKEVSDQIAEGMRFKHLMA